MVARGRLVRGSADGALARLLEGPAVALGRARLEVVVRRRAQVPDRWVVVEVGQSQPGDDDHHEDPGERHTGGRPHLWCSERWWVGHGGS